MLSMENMAEDESTAWSTALKESQEPKRWARICDTYAASAPIAAIFVSFQGLFPTAYFQTTHKEKGCLEQKL